MRFLFLALLLVVAGCQSVGRSDWKQSGFERATPIPAILQPGSEIQLRFPYAPELDTDQVVPPDGLLSFQLVGEVNCSGLTASGLRRELVQRYGEFLKQPELNVTVASWGGRQVFVGGQVLRPGPIEFPASMTLLESVMLAGGPLMRAANVRNVLVIRREDGEHRGYAVDLGPVLDGQAADPFHLRPKDVVFVPRTEVVVAGQWIEQHVIKLIPGLVYSRDAGPARISLDSRGFNF